MRRARVSRQSEGRAQKRSRSTAWLWPRRTRTIEVIALEEALDELAAIALRASQVVELRFFGGFSVAETAEALDVSDADGDERLEYRARLASPAADVQRVR